MIHHLSTFDLHELEKRAEARGSAARLAWVLDTLRSIDTADIAVDAFNADSRSGWSSVGGMMRALQTVADELERAAAGAARTTTGETDE